MLAFLACVVFIFGPSCGGKSTLSKAIVKQLGPSWSYLDRDQLIEDGFCTEEKANDALETSLLLLESKNQHVVVDAQIPWRAPKFESELYVLVYAPLSELLTRDAKRTLQLQRSPQRAYYARLYVEETFAEVFKAPATFGFDYNLVFDSSQCPIETEVKEVLNLLSQ